MEPKFKVGDKVMGVSGKTNPATIVEVGEFIHSTSPGKIFTYKIKVDGYDYTTYTVFYGIDYHLSEEENIRKLTKLERALK